MAMSSGLRTSLWAAGAFVVGAVAGALLSHTPPKLTTLGIAHIVTGTSQNPFQNQSTDPSLGTFKLSDITLTASSSAESCNLSGPVVQVNWSGHQGTLTGKAYGSSKIPHYWSFVLAFDQDDPTQLGYLADVYPSDKFTNDTNNSVTMKFQLPGGLTTSPYLSYVAICAYYPKVA